MKKWSLTKGQAFSQPGCKLGIAGAEGGAVTSQVKLGKQFVTPLDGGPQNLVYVTPSRTFRQD